MIYSSYKKILLTAVTVLLTLVGGGAVHAQAPPPVNPQSGSVGLNGQISAPPPTQAPTITTPSNGQTFTNTPITVAGLCPQGVIVKVFKNGVFGGSAPCNRGSFSMQIDLFSGRNDLTARAADALDQETPDSNTVSVTFNDARFGGTGTRISLTSNYAKRGTNPGQQLTWPIILTGGVGPYAISTDWGDGKPATLQTVEFPGVFNITHTYDSPGSYNIIVRGTDKNGDTAFLQLVGVANGTPTGGAGAGSGSGNNADNARGSAGQDNAGSGDIPLAVGVVSFSILAFLSFWLGSRYALLSLRKKLERGSGSMY